MRDVRVGAFGQGIVLPASSRPAGCIPPPRQIPRTNIDVHMHRAYLTGPCHRLTRTLRRKPRPSRYTTPRTPRALFAWVNVVNPIGTGQAGCRSYCSTKSIGHRGGGVRKGVGSARRWDQTKVHRAQVVEPLSKGKGPRGEVYPSFAPGGVVLVIVATAVVFVAVFMSKPFHFLLPYRVSYSV